MFENLRGRDVEAGSGGLGDHLQAEDGIATELEEVVVHADVADTEDFAPRHDESALGQGARRRVVVLQVRAGVKAVAP